jgi:hypothetical protein
MRSKRLPLFSSLAAVLILASVWVGTWQAQAQPTIVSTVPANGATGVATTTTVVFTFSTAMDTTASDAIFYDSSFNFYTTTPAWSAGDTVLTCTPVTPFPANTTISWVATGQDPVGNPIGGIPIGTFSTGTGGGTGGSGTNAITSFSVGKVHHYNQTSASASTPDPSTPYGFSGVTSLSSNRTATSVTLTNSTAEIYYLTHLPPPSADKFLLATNFTSLSTFDAAFPAGNYSFFVQAATSNQTVVVNLPTAANQPQPGAPHLTNFVAAQTVNPGQPFVLAWDAFPGGTVGDYIDVDIGSVYLSPDPGLPGALNGTAITFTIPAGTLLPNTAYPSRVGFFRLVGTTNVSANYATAAYRATYTEFNLVTGSSGTSSLVLTNPAYAPQNFSFDVLRTNGQVVIVEYKTNLTASLWQPLLTNNSAGTSFHVVAPQASSNRFLFFRARSGP